MRNEVTVDGIKLTRYQVEEAVRLLERPALKLFTRLRRKNAGRYGRLLFGEVQRGYAEAAEIDGLFTVVDMNGMGYTENTEEAILKFWDVVPEWEDSDE